MRSSSRSNDKLLFESLLILFESLALTLFTTHLFLSVYLTKTRKTPS